MESFNNILQRLRKEHKLSQQSLGNAINVTQQCISEWEKGNMEPTLSNLIKLAELFDVSIDYLAGRKDF